MQDFSCQQDLSKAPLAQLLAWAPGPPTTSWPCSPPVRKPSVQPVKRLEHFVLLIFKEWKTRCTICQEETHEKDFRTFWEIQLTVTGAKLVIYAGPHLHSLRRGHATLSPYSWRRNWPSICGARSQLDGHFRVMK